jgi:hypothetical protein
MPTTSPTIDAAIDPIAPATSVAAGVRSTLASKWAVARLSQRPSSPPPT